MSVQIQGNNQQVSKLESDIAKRKLSDIKSSSMLYTAPTVAVGAYIKHVKQWVPV